jgi:hypothetical protein
MATPSGIISTADVGGLTLGAGSGHLSRKYGLSIDTLLAADMVLADGTFVTADQDHNEDLFRAIRVSRKVKDVTTPKLPPPPEVMRRYEEFITDAPEEINGFFAFLTVPAAPMFPEKLHKRLSDEAIAQHLQHESEMPSMFSTVHLYPINGAVHHVAKRDTAFSYRHTKWAEVIVGVDPEPANKQRACEFHDGGSRGARGSHLWAKLCETAAGQNEIRSQKSVSGEPEYRAGRGRRRSQVKWVLACPRKWPCLISGLGKGVQLAALVEGRGRQG